MFGFTRTGGDHSGSRSSKAGHLTMAKSVGASLTRTGQFLRRKLWIWPVLGCLVLLGVGLGVRHAIETTMREALASELQTLLNVEVAMLRTWYEGQQITAEAAAQRLGGG